MSSSDSITNPNKKISKKIHVYLILLFITFGVVGSLYILATEPHKAEEVAEKQTIKETQLLEAETGNIDDAKKMIEAQIAEAQQEIDDIQKQKEAAFKAFETQQPNSPPSQKTPPPFGPNLSTSLPGAPQPPAHAALRVFDGEMANVSRATTQPEIFDFSEPSQILGITPRSDSPAINGQEVLVDEDTPKERATIDERWRSPPSPASTPLKAASNYLLQEGSVVDVVLMQSLNTQNPGRISFRVVSDVYDSIGGRHLLIPKGTKLLGRYGKPPSFGLDRVPISINRAIFSDGRSINLTDTNITDAMGAIGAPAEFHSNIWRAIGPAALVAWIGFKADEALTEDLPTSTTGTSTSAQTISQSTIPEIQKRILQRYGSAQPYYTENVGKRLTIIIASDIAIPPEH